MPSPYRARFAALYAGLAAVVCLSGVAAVAAYRATPDRTATHRCWASGSTFTEALYGAASCRFGARNVLQLGWMPYLGALPEQRLEEVAVIRPDGGMTFWIASFSASSRTVTVEHWAPCRASNEFC